MSFIRSMQEENVVQLTQKAVSYWRTAVRVYSWSSPKELFIVGAVYNSLDPQLRGLCGAAPHGLRQLLLCLSPSANLTPGGRARLPWFTKLSLCRSYLCGNERLARNDGCSWSSNRNPESIQIDVPEPAESCWWVTFIGGRGCQHLAPSQSNQANWLLSFNNRKIQSPSLEQRVNLPGSQSHSLAVYFNQIVKIMIKFEFDYVPIKITREPTQETVSQSLFRQ